MVWVYPSQNRFPMSYLPQNIFALQIKLEFKGSRVIGVARGAYGIHKFLEHIVILCFVRRYPKQNGVILQIWNMLALPKNFGLATLLSRVH